jgi:hypothetical protein
MEETIILLGLHPHVARSLRMELSFKSVIQAAYHRVCVESKLFKKNTLFVTVSIDYRLYGRMFCKQIQCVKLSARSLCLVCFPFVYSVVFCALCVWFLLSCFYFKGVGEENPGACPGW